MQPPLIEKVTTSLFIDTHRDLYYDRLIGSATKFVDMVVIGEMIEGAMKSKRIEVEETRGCTMLKDEKEAHAVFLKS